MGHVLHPETILTRIKDLQRQIDELRKSVGLNSAVLTQGLSIKTAEDGARVDIGSGNISIVGDVTAEDAPFLTFESSDATAYAARLQAYENLGGSAGTVLDMSIVENNEAALNNGGQVVLYADAAIVSWHPKVGTQMLIGLSWPYDDLFTFRGKWPNFIFPDPTDALYTGQASSSSNTSYALSYGATMASTMVPIITVEDDPATPYAYCVSVSSTSGFTAKFAATTNGAYNLNFWCFRV